MVFSMRNELTTSKQYAEQGQALSSADACIVRPFWNHQEGLKN